MKNNEDAPLTKAEFKEFMQDFRKETNEQFMQMYKYMNTRFDETDKRFVKIDERLNRIMEILDESVSDYKTLVAETAAGAHGITRIDDTLDDHETRIGQLENLELGREAA